MVFEANGAALSLPAAANAIRIARFVTMAAAGISESAAATEEVVGISLEAIAAANTGLAVACARPNGGKVEVAAGAAVLVGALVTTDATGRAVTAATGNTVLGVALTASGAADEVITIVFSKGAKAAL